MITSLRERHQVMELQPVTRGAAPPLAVEEGALFLVAAPTARLIGSGIRRDDGVGSASCAALRGESVAAKRARSSSRTSSVMARSKTAAEIAIRDLMRSSARARSILSWSSALAVNCTL